MKPRCRYCPKQATASCGCCCHEHAAMRYRRTDGGPSVREFLTSKGEV